MLTTGICRHCKSFENLCCPIDDKIRFIFLVTSKHSWKFGLNSNHSPNFGLLWFLSIHCCLKRQLKCCYFLQQHIYVKQHFQHLPIWWLNTDLDILYKVNCVYLVQKYHQELAICIKQGKHIPLTNFITQCRYWMWFSLNIFDKFHFYFYMGVHEIDPEVEMGPGSQKFGNHWIRRHNCFYSKEILA